MATITSVGSGAWGTAGTWDAGVPVDGDDVVIASGHTVTFNVDQSAFTTGVKVTITGTLTHTTAAGNYCLFAKTGASIVGAGTWNIGTSGTPIPFASKHTITGAAGWYVDGNAGLTMTVFGAEPSIKYVKLSANAAIGQTELSVDTDVTSDIWAAGDIVRIATYNATEERVIAAGGIAAGTITVTAGLTAAKGAGDYIFLITRNIKIIGVGAVAQNLIYRFGVNKLTVGSGMWYATTAIIIFNSCTLSVSGGTFSVNYRFGLSITLSLSGGVITASGNIHNSFVTMTGGVLCAINVPYNTSLNMSGGLITKSQYGWQASTNVTITGGTFSFCNVAVSQCTNVTISGGTFTSNTSIASGAPMIVTGGTFTSNTYGFSSNRLIMSGISIGATTRDLSTCTGILHNVVFAASTEHFNYTSQGYFWLNCQSEDHDGVVGALKAWCKGGVVTSQTSVKPTGYTQAYLLDPESATYPVFFTKTFTVSAGEVVDVEVQLRKDASMTYLPRVYLVKSIENPLVGATPTDSFTMTNSTDTWETDTFVVDNSAGTFELEYCMYFVAQNATDNAYAAYKITPRSTGTGGGAVSIQPLSGRLGL